MKEGTNEDTPQVKELQDGLNDTMERIADLDEFVILTDPVGAAALAQYEATRLSRGMVVQVQPTGTVDPRVLHLMGEGRPAVTWCSVTPAGNDIARKVHNSLHQVGELRHITLIDPAYWTGSPTIKKLIETASPKRPPVNRGGQLGSEGRPGRRVRRGGIGGRLRDITRRSGAADHSPLRSRAADR